MERTAAAAVESFNEGPHMDPLLLSQPILLTLNSIPLPLGQLSSTNESWCGVLLQIINAYPSMHQSVMLSAAGIQILLPSHSSLSKIAFHKVQCAPHSRTHSHQAQRLLLVISTEDFCITCSINCKCNRNCWKSKSWLLLLLFFVLFFVVPAVSPHTGRTSACLS